MPMNWKIKIPSNLSLKNLLNNKRFTVPFSIAAAFVMWLVIMINQNPRIERTFADIPVNITLDNPLVGEDGMQVIGDISQNRFTVAISGPTYVLSALKNDDFKLFASAAEVNAPGEYQLEVYSSGRAFAECEITSITPATVSVFFDYVDTKEFTVTANAEGASAVEGLIAETAVVSGTENDTITIKGPRTVVNRIDSVVAYAAVNQTLSESTTFDSEIRLYDENGEQIDSKNLTLSATNVKVTVPISKRASVPVIADFGNLPSGFDKSSISYSLDHSSVTVIGTPDAIDKIKQLTLSAIDITTVSTSSNKFDVSPRLPEGVRLLDAIDHFTVTVNTSGYTEKVFTVSRVKYSGLSAGLKASYDSAIKNVRICGPRSIINKLNESSLYAEVDLTDKTSGEHTVQVKIKSDDHNNIWQVGTYNTTVKIE